MLSLEQSIFSLFVNLIIFVHQKNLGIHSKKFIGTLAIKHTIITRLGSPPSKLATAFFFWKTFENCIHVSTITFLEIGYIVDSGTLKRKNLVLFHQFNFYEINLQTLRESQKKQVPYKWTYWRWKEKNNLFRKCKKAIISLFFARQLCSNTNVANSNRNLEGKK